MKKIFSLIIAISFLLNGCGTKRLVQPPMAIYKTNADYFEFYCLAMGEDSVPNSFPWYTLDDVRIRVIDQDTVYSWRVRLEEGYVLGGEIADYCYFTDIRISEIVKRSSEGGHFGPDELKNRIIDYDPFIECYIISEEDATKHWIGDIDKHEALLLRAEEINEIIRDGNLEDYFVRLK